MSGFTSFKLKPKTNDSKQTTTTNLQSKFPLQVHQTSAKPNYGATTFSHKHATEEDYFESDEEKEANKKKECEYQKASDSSDEGNQSEEEDPLDSFMADIEKKAKKDLEKMGKKSEAKKEVKGTRDDIEEEDDQESYFRWLEENPNAGVVQGEDEDEQDIEYDDEGNIIVPEKKKYIDPLPPIDHSQIEYDKFEKNFYQEHDDIKELTNAQVDDLRKTLGIKVSGASASKPVCSFAHFNFDEQLMRAIRKSEFTQPTPIQAQSIPVALSGRDIIGIAKTGSGKTDAYLWPALVHIMHQKELQSGDGPIVLILAPTRELVQQVRIKF